MTHAPLYVTVPQFKTAVSIPDGLTDADVERALGAASRAIEKVTGGRQFWLDDEVSTRKYTALSRNLVVVDDVAEIESVKTNGVELSESAWFGEPSNAPQKVEPYIWIESNGSFSKDRGAIEVTGRFGWPEVPDTVKQIVLIVGSKLFKRTREAPWGVVGSGMVDGLSLRITRDDPDLELMVGSLKRAEVPHHG